MRWILSLTLVSALLSAAPAAVLAETASSPTPAPTASTETGAEPEKETPTAEETGPDAEAKETVPSEETAMPAMTLTQNAEDGTVVTLEAPAGTFPEGSYLEVTEVAPDVLNHIIETADQSAADENKTVAGVIAYDVTVYDAEGNEVEPANGNAVSVTFQNVETTGDSAEVVHADDSGNAIETVASDVATPEDTTDICFQAESFTIYYVVSTAVDPETDADTATVSGNTFHTVVEAVNAAADGDTIEIRGTVLWGGDSEEAKKTVTITSADADAQGHIVLNGANGNNDTSPNITNFNTGTILKNVYLEQSQGINFLFANGHPLDIQADVTMKSNGSVCSGETSGSNVIAVGGSYQKEVASTDMTLDAGNYEYVIGGGFGQNVTGDVHLETGIYTGGILGGGYRADVGGSTSLTISGDVGVLGGVYGGGYEGNVAKDTNVTISSKIGISGYGEVIGGSCYRGSVGGSTSVTIGSTGNVGSGVYGGNGPTVNDPNPLGAGNNQRYSQKANEQVIYPAARTMDKGNIGQDTHVTVETGALCNEAVYGGGADTPVNGSTYVDIRGTVYGEGNAEGVYGGGGYVGADVAGNTNVVIADSASIPMREVNYSYMGGDTRIGGAVFGGGRFCAVKGDTNVTLNGRVGSEGLGGLVFGGGYGRMSTGTATVEGTSNIIVNAAPYSYTSEKHLGWQQYTDSRLTGNPNYNVFWGQTGVFGGGMNSDCDAVSVIDINADLEGNPVYGDGLYEWITGKSTINVNQGGVVYKVWGYYDDEQAGDYYKRAEGDYARVYFKNNSSKAIQINSVDLVQVSAGSDVTIDNEAKDNQQLVAVKDLTIDRNAKLTLLASTSISGNYTGDGTGTLAVPAIAAGANSSLGRLAVGGTVAGKTTIRIADAGSVVPAADQIYVTSVYSAGDADSSFVWADERNNVTMARKSKDASHSEWILVNRQTPVQPTVTPTSAPTVQPTNTPAGRTCQDDGYPAGYYWNGTACVIDATPAPAPNTPVAPVPVPVPAATPAPAAAVTPAPSASASAAPSVTVSASPSATTTQPAYGRENGSWALLNLIMLSIRRMM